MEQLLFLDPFDESNIEFNLAELFLADCCTEFDEIVPNNFNGSNNLFLYNTYCFLIRWVYKSHGSYEWSQHNNIFTS